MTLRFIDEKNFIEIDELDNDRMMISLSDNDDDEEIGNVIIEKYEAKQIISFLQKHFNL
jgi:hypothetical protein